MKAIKNDLKVDNWLRGESMRGILNSFIDRLNYGQSYLFLGQKYLTE